MDLARNELGWWLFAILLVVILLIIVVFSRLAYSGTQATNQPAAEDQPETFEELFDQIPVSGRPTPGYVFGEGIPNGFELREHLEKTLPSISFKKILVRYPDMDSRKRAMLIKIEELGYREPNLKEPLRVPVLSIEEFFDGNDSDGAIAPNLDPQLSNEYFKKVLKEIRSDPDVSFVAIDTWHLDASGEVEPDWPSAEFVYVGGKFSEDRLLKWQELLKADDVLPGWEDGVFPKGISSAHSKTSVYRFWWD